MTRAKHTQRHKNHVKKDAFFTSAPFEGFVFYASVGRTSGYLVVYRCISRWTTTHPSRLGAPVPRTALSVRSPLAQSSSSHARARERTRRANERTNERTRIFFSRRYRHDAHRYASRARLDRECARAHSSACIRAGMRLGFGDARERDAGDAETREGARVIFGHFMVRFHSRRRRAVVARSSTFARARTTTGRRPNVDRTSTGRHVTGVGLRG